jgi:hypothetical protein
MKIKTMERVVPSKNRSNFWAEVGRVKEEPAVVSGENGAGAHSPVDEMLHRAIQDATQAFDPDLRWEALAWLWVCCPDVAEQLFLPWPERIDVQRKATDYLSRYPTF